MWRVDNREHADVQTVSENLGKFSRREVEQARAARDMLLRMCFSSLSDAIDISGIREVFQINF
jgi:hypothetical protein